VVLEAGVVVGPHCVVEGDTVLGAGTHLSGHANIGGEPQDLRSLGSAGRLVVGPGCVFREFVTVHVGASLCRGETWIGAGVTLMTSAHVAHDVILGDGATLSTAAALASEAEVGASAVLGVAAVVHPGVRIGRLAMVGAGALCAQDVPPFTLAQGDRARLYGLNIAGLRRAGFPDETLSALKAAWRTLFSSGLPLRNGLGQARAAAEGRAEVLEILDFVESAERGVCKAGSP
jgi:UDP-N-acetylglucosamine acyltransferase